MIQDQRVEMLLLYCMCPVITYAWFTCMQLSLAQDSEFFDIMQKREAKCYIILMEMIGDIR